MTTTIRSPHLEAAPTLIADVTVYVLRDGVDGTKYWHVIVRLPIRRSDQFETFTRDYLAVGDDTPGGSTANQAATDLLGIVLSAEPLAVDTRGLT